ncbi:MAG TPA: hypothetical protein PKW55_07015 [Spirochaetota bacterium]|nr:hypothetical protein [Spirochaetota bacterium]HOM38734.1 hypothetical protein [Spirochaetota bacterium]HPQ49532.1 hypothetical protein [Spirochaetota bacterium]
MSFLDDIKELRIQYLRSVIDEIVENINSIDDKVNYEKIRDFSHRIKGSGSSYGFDFITEKAILISEMAKAFKTPEDIKKILLSLKNLCEASLKGLSGDFNG